MSLGAKLEAKLNKKYPPSSRIDEVFIGNDITILTNKEGEAVKLYIGERRENGAIKGEMYERREKWLTE